MAVDLQRRCGGHGDALAGMLGAPHAEILIEPFRDEPEIDTLKRRFERDLDLSVLDLQLDQLQPNRALIMDTRRNVCMRMPTPGAFKRPESASNAPRLKSSVMRWDDASPG